MTPQQKAEAFLEEFGMLPLDWRLEIVIKAFESEYDEGFQNGINRARDEQEYAARHDKSTGPVA